MGDRLSALLLSLMALQLALSRPKLLSALFINGQAYESIVPDQFGLKQTFSSLHLMLMVNVKISIPFQVTGHALNEFNMH